MKKLFIAVMIAATFTSCKKDKVDDRCGTIQTRSYKSNPPNITYDFSVKFPSGIIQSFSRTEPIGFGSGYAVGQQFCKN